MPTVYVTMLGLAMTLSVSIIGFERPVKDMSSAPACGEWRSWTEWLDGALVLEQKRCPEGGKTLFWARIQNASDETIKVRVHAYKGGYVPAKCGNGSPSLNLVGTLPPSGTRTDWTYLEPGETLIPCAIREH